MPGRAAIPGFVGSFTSGPQPAHETSPLPVLAGNAMIADDIFVGESGLPASSRTGRQAGVTGGTRVNEPARDEIQPRDGNEPLGR